MEVILRKEARERNLTHYFTGNLCKNGHLSLRNTNTADCLECGRNKSARLYKLNGNSTRDPASNKVACKTYYSKNKDKKRQYEKSESYKIIKREVSARRRARKKQAMPLWADLQEIKKVYLDCPEGYHVDHIVPLQNDNVCGLHVENNLQYLTAKDNIIKGNSFNIYE